MAAYDVDTEIVEFLSEVGKYIEKTEFAAYLAAFCANLFRCNKCAVIGAQFDVRPYEILYSEGYDRKLLEEFLNESNSPILEALEINRNIVNKFDHPTDSAIYQILGRHKIYLGIPLVSQSNIMGFILLGGERQLMRFNVKDFRFARLISVQAGNHLQNIQTVQTAIQSQKMAELGNMASQLAHDFQSFITLVKLDTDPENRTRQHANYMEKLVQDLLNYARPQELRLSEENINLLIDMTLDLITIPENVVIEKHYSDSIPEINVDSNQIRRVFLNLFKNSMRAMHSTGGRLKITTRPLRPLSKVRRNPWIYVEIFDEGEGIPEDFLERIFDPFFTTHKPDGGNGMGLAIVKQIINRHKGFIDVTSKQGKGTIFNIRLPYLI